MLLAFGDSGGPSEMVGVPSGFLGSNLDRSADIAAPFDLSARIVSRATWVEGEAFCIFGHVLPTYQPRVDRD